MKSEYLNRDVEIPMRQFQDGAETIDLIPHDFLEDIIFNDPICNANMVQCHYTPIVVTEPGHYAFLCAINDKNGRRVESVGESSLPHMKTEIAKEYPVLMAVKRAFDDAAIKFLKFPGKCYSDQQINPANLDVAVNTGDKATTQKTGTAKSKASDEPKAEEKKAPADTKATPEPAAEETSAAPSPATTPDTATDPAGAPAEDDMSFGATGSADSEEGPVETAPAAEAPSGDGDKFDTSIVTCGTMKRQGLSVRACYAKNPDSIRWIALQMTTARDDAKQQQEICREFLALMNDEEWKKWKSENQ